MTNLFLIGLLSLALVACAGANPNSVVGAFSVKARSDMDDQKCQEFGYPKGSEAYSKCRLELEKARAVSQTGSGVSENVVKTRVRIGHQEPFAIHAHAVLVQCGYQLPARARSIEDTDDYKAERHGLLVREGGTLVIGVLLPVRAS